MRFTTLLILMAFVAAWSGKQKILVRLREPLRAESVKISVPELTNARGETRDLDTTLDLGPVAKAEGPKLKDATLKLNMTVRPVGKGGIQVTLTLPDPAYVEIVMMDFYGKNLATLLAGNLQPGVYPLHTLALGDADGNGIKFLTLRLNGKVALKRVITKVR